MLQLQMPLNLRGYKNEFSSPFIHAHLGWEHMVEQNCLSRHQGARTKRRRPGPTMTQRPPKNPNC
jgi:hypothetical protein